MSDPVARASAQNQHRREIARHVKPEYVDDLIERNKSNIFIGEGGVVRTTSHTGSLHDYDAERPLRALANEIVGLAGNEARIRPAVTEEDLARKRASGLYRV